MSDGMLGLLGLVVLLFLMMIRMPVGFAMALVGFVGVAWVKGPAAAIGVLLIPLYLFNIAAAFGFLLLCLVLLMDVFRSLGRLNPRPMNSTPTLEGL
jgi:C4-dicarboxylate transporter, DctM subunit